MSRRAGVAGARTALLLSMAATSMLVLAQPAASAAAAGGLDPGFGDGGVVTTEVGSSAVLNWGLVEPDGKVVGVGAANVSGAGHLAAVRYKPDGELDSSFGSGGLVTIPIGKQSMAASVVRQPDGKLLVIGHAMIDNRYNAVVVRLLPNGSPDPSFGVSGKFTVTAANGTMPWSGALQDSGKLVLAGTALVSGYAPRIFAMRVTSDGQLDQSFGDAGVTIASSARASGWALAIAPGGRPVIAGAGTSGGIKVMVTVGLTNDGLLDAGFGTNGLVVSRVGTAASGLGIVANPDGSVIVTGPAFTFRPLAAAVKLTESGARDPSFGNKGVAVWNGYSSTNTAVRAPDGKVLTAGVGMTVSRINANGSLDRSFGQNGIATIPVGEQAAANGVALGPDGRIVLTGTADIGGKLRFATARLFG